ncbi:hypothetical protein A5790_02575 [Mycobacterium sp. 852002-51152_SCH6134967]|nr:hypothetical protein A5790_02575 [Mycobacterium sp. 852002-51152_SCH6134967]
MGRARAAAPGWARTPAAERAAALTKAAAAVRAAVNERETGKTRDDALGGVDAGAGTLVQYAELGPRHRGRSLHGSWSATDLMVPNRAASLRYSPRGTIRSLWRPACWARRW